MADETDIHFHSEDTPILTRYEPDFRRLFARGSLLRIHDDDPDTLQVGFWSSRDRDIEIDEDITGTGYRLEAEVFMTWSTARRLHKLLGQYIEEHAPEPKASEGPSVEASPDA